MNKYTDRYSNKSNTGPFLILITLYLLTLFFTFSGYMFEYRYLKYTLPFIALILLIKNYDYYGAVNDYYKKNLVLYLFIVFWNFLVVTLKEDLGKTYFHEEIIFILSPVIFCFILFKFYNPDNKEYYIKFLFWGTVVTFIFHFIRPDRAGLSLNIIDAFTTSEYRGESTHAFYFPLFLAYFIHKKNTLYSVFTIILTILSFKRIVFLAFIILFILYFLFKKVDVKKNKSLISVIAVIVNLLIVGILYYTTYGFFDKDIMSNTNLAPDELLMGRQYLYSTVLFYEPFTLYGVGMGKLNFLLTSILGFKTNVHSDLLKNLIEFGPILYVIWIYYFYKNNIINVYTLLCVMFVNIQFISDNAFIYFDVIFFFFFVVSYFVIEEKEESEKINDTLRIERIKA